MGEKFQYFRKHYNDRKRTTAYIFISESTDNKNAVFVFFFAKDTLFNHLIGAGTYRIGHLKPYKKGLLVSKRKLQS